METKKYEKFKILTPEERKRKRKQYQEKYINKLGGVEKYREMVRKTSLEGNHKKFIKLTPEEK